MTPYETYKLLDAHEWRDEHTQRLNIKLAWLVASLSRQKRIPSLKAILASAKPPKKLEGRELRKRRQEFAEMATPDNLDIINQVHKKKISGKK